MSTCLRTGEISTCILKVKLARVGLNGHCAVMNYIYIYVHHHVCSDLAQSNNLAYGYFII